MVSREVVDAVPMRRVVRDVCLEELKNVLGGDDTVRGVWAG